MGTHVKFEECLIEVVNVHFEECLIDEVKEHPVLYDKKHPKYFDVAYKTKIWNDIANKLKQSTGAECKKKWKHLRETFVKKNRPSQKVDSGTWIHFENMRFLKDYISARKPTRIEFKNEMTLDNSSGETSQQLLSNDCPTTLDGALFAITEAANCIKKKVSAKESTGKDAVLNALRALLNEIPAVHQDSARAELFQFIFELKRKYGGSMEGISMKQS